jgi:hypothetical protein
MRLMLFDTSIILINISFRSLQFHLCDALGKEVGQYRPRNMAYIICAVLRPPYREIGRRWLK